MRAPVLPAFLRLPLAAVFAFVLSCTLVTGSADAKKRKKRASTTPSVSSVAPAKLAVGDILVIKGKNFKVGTGANTVVFRKASGGKFVFATTLAATATRVTLKLPASIAAEMDLAGGAQQPTRFQLRVVAKRASAFTTVAKSPVVIPAPGTVNPSTADCDKDGVPDPADADDDNDGLSDAIETQYGLNTCAVDTDLDGVWDSYEFESALDLNSRAVPFPGKKPWANPLDGKDADSDFDGDGLTMAQEHKLWQAAGRPFPLNYSDGDQYTGGPVAAPDPDVNNLDRDSDGGAPNLRTGSGYLSDDEKDYDGDGLSNQSEFNGRMTQAYWAGVYEKEIAYPLRPFADLDATNPDSDGDGIVDGLDDQDSDGWNNISEQFRYGTIATNQIAYMVNPFNPCLPDYHSRSCSRYVLIGGEPWAPFDALPNTTPIGWDVVREVRTESPTPDYVPGS